MKGWGAGKIGYDGEDMVSYDPNQPTWGGAPSGAYQPPEGTNPGNPPPSGGTAYQGQPAYYGAYPGPMAPSTSGWAIASLILSIASYLGLPIIGAIVGVIFGHMALNEIKNAGGRIEGRGLAIAGLALGYGHFVLAACAIAAFLAIVLGAFAGAGFPR